MGLKKSWFFRLCRETSMEPIFPLGSRDLSTLITMPILSHLCPPTIFAYQEYLEYHNNANTPTLHTLVPSYSILNIFLFDYHDFFEYLSTLITMITLTHRIRTSITIFFVLNWILIFVVSDRNRISILFAINRISMQGRSVLSGIYLSGGHSRLTAKMPSTDRQAKRR